MKTKLKFYVILDGQGGELAREACEVEGDEGNLDDLVNDAAATVIEGFVLSIGDTIKIVGEEG